MSEINETVLERIEKEITKIEQNENKIYFFVIDTKGNPSGSLEYIYKLAYYLKNNNYNVAMLYQTSKDEEFVGVKDWLGENYANIEHISVGDGNLSVSPSDILFIPEIFSNVMVQTKNLPCKRIAILQNYDYMVEQMPFSVQWGDLHVMECVTNTKKNSDLLKEVFPYVKTTVIEPNIDDIFGTTSEPKKMVVNIISKNQSDINKIVKPFYWKYPMFKWVSFRELRGLPKQEYANALREAEVTVWVDDDSSFGYSALEAMKSGNIVIAKTTNNEMPWSKTNDEYNDACIWFDNFNDVHRIIASVIRSIVTDVVPEKIVNDAKVVSEQYSKNVTETQIVEYVKTTIEKRKNEIMALLTQNEQ